MPQVAVWRMRIESWIIKAKGARTRAHTDTHTQHAMLTAFPQRQWLHDHALIVTFTYIGCLVAVYSCLAHRVKTEQWPVQVCAVCVELSELRNSYTHRTNE